MNTIIIKIKKTEKAKSIWERAEHSFSNSSEEHYIAIHFDDVTRGSLEKMIENPDRSISEKELNLILMIVYDGSSNDKKESSVEKIYTGSICSVSREDADTDPGKYVFDIRYQMEVRLNSDNSGRVINNIIKKVDLDLIEDFETGTYVRVNTMDSLFSELKDRIIESRFRRADNHSKLTVGRAFDNDKKEETILKNREMIVRTKSFRRLVDKAQIFGAKMGDHYRTRMTHTLEVNQIAKAIAEKINDKLERIINLDMVEAIALAHDIGHTPFGHQGERTLDDILSGEIDVGFHIRFNKEESNVENSEEKYPDRPFGGFKHNYQSARILTKLEDVNSDYEGLDIAPEIIEGVLKHTSLKKEIDVRDFLNDSYLELIPRVKEITDDSKIASTVEGQIVAIADEIAQRGHDVDDALKSGAMTLDGFLDCLKAAGCDELRTRIDALCASVKQAERAIVDKKDLYISIIVDGIYSFFIDSTVEASIKEMKKLSQVDDKCEKKVICLGSDNDRTMRYLEKVIHKEVLMNRDVVIADHNGEQVVKTLFRNYYKNPRLLPASALRRIFIECLRSRNNKVSLSALNLCGCDPDIAVEEIKEWTEREIDITEIDPQDEENCSVTYIKRRILVRTITDYIAGMTDSFAMKEYKRLNL